MMNDQPTPREILDTLLDFRDAVMGKLVKHDRLFEAMDLRVDRLQDRMVRGFDSVDLRLDRLEERIGALELRA